MGSRMYNVSNVFNRNTFYLLLFFCLFVYLKTNFLDNMESSKLNWLISMHLVSSFILAELTLAYSFSRLERGEEALP